MSVPTSLVAGDAAAFVGRWSSPGGATGLTWPASHVNQRASATVHVEQVVGDRAGRRRGTRESPGLARHGGQREQCGHGTRHRTLCLVPERPLLDCDNGRPDMTEQAARSQGLEHDEGAPAAVGRAGMVANRRTVLAGGLALAAAACTPASNTPPSNTRTSNTA